MLHVRQRLALMFGVVVRSSFTHGVFVPREVLAERLIGKRHTIHSVTACLGKLLPSHESKRKSPYCFSSHSLMGTKQMNLSKKTIQFGMAIARQVTPGLSVIGLQLFGTQRFS